MSTSKSKNFSIKEAVNFGFKLAKENIVFFIGVIAVWIIITIFSSSIQNILEANKQYLIAFSFIVFMWVVNISISMGMISIVLKLIDNKKPKLKDLYYTKSMINYIHVSLLKAFISLLGLILLIFPVFIYIIRLQFVSYLIIDKGMEPFDALSKSWEITRGNTWKLFFFSLILLLINILGLLVFIVGLFITVPLTMIANAYVYRKLLAQSVHK
jgi:uncharacterized membrane protein